MSLTKRKDGRYCKSKTINGVKVYFYSSEPTEKRAEKDIERQLLEYQGKIEKGKTFKETADEWDTEYRNSISDINYRKNTKAGYERIKQYFGNKPIDEIKSLDINNFITSMVVSKFSKKTIATHKSILNMIFRYAVLHGYAESNPVSNVRLPNNLPQTERSLPTDDEIKIVSRYQDTADLLPFFLLYTGCRKSEALALKREDFDFNKNIIKIHAHVIHNGNKPVYENITKTQAGFREIILLKRLKEVLPKNFNGYLFSMNGDGAEPLTKRAYDVRWAKYCKEHNVNITAHQLRHGYATMLFEAKVDLKDAQELMGHSDINLTRQIYTHIRNKRKIETAEKLNNFNF